MAAMITVRAEALDVSVTIKEKDGGDARQQVDAGTERVFDLGAVASIAFEELEPS